MVKEDPLKIDEESFLDAEKRVKMGGDDWEGVLNKKTRNFEEGRIFPMFGMKSSGAGGRWVWVRVRVRVLSNQHEKLKMKWKQGILA